MHHTLKTVERRDRSPRRATMLSLLLATVLTAIPTAGAAAGDEAQAPLRATNSCPAMEPEPPPKANIYLEYVHGRDPFDEGIPILGNRPAPVPRERNLAETGGRIEYEEVRIGFNWSHAFNEHWTVRHRFDANFLDTPTTPVVSVGGLEDPTQCSQSGCPVSRVIFQNPTQSGEVVQNRIAPER